MHVRTWVATSLAFLAFFATLLSVPAALASDEQPEPADGARALDGEWVFVEDRTEGRPIEQQQPSMSTRVRLRVEPDAVVLIRSDGEIRMALDGSPTEIVREGRPSSRYRGEWKDGAFTYQSEPVRQPDDTRTGGLIQWELRPTPEGLLARVAVDPPNGMHQVALYRHPQDIAMPTPAKGTISDVAWIAGAWVGTSGTQGTTSIEERWTPPLGGSILGVSRTVARDRLRAFEYLRILERDGGLVYVAQPNGAPPTTFVLTELSPTRAVFENPRHDFPQRITYELSAEGQLTTSVGYAKGGRPQRFEYKREEQQREEQPKAAG